MNSDIACEQMRGDRITKWMIVGTICLVVFMACGTICYNAIATGSEEALRAVKEIAMFVLGGISTMLVKTGVEALGGRRQQDNPDLPEEIGEAVVAASKEEAIEVKAET